MAPSETIRQVVLSRRLATRRTRHRSNGASAMQDYHSHSQEQTPVMARRSHQDHPPSISTEPHLHKQGPVLDLVCRTVSLDVLLTRHQQSTRSLTDLSIRSSGSLTPLSAHGLMLRFCLRRPTNDALSGRRSKDKLVSRSRERPVYHHHAIRIPNRHSQGLTTRAPPRERRRIVRETLPSRRNGM